MMSRQSTVWMALSILFVTGCVPMSQFAEVRDDRDALDQDLETLTQQVEALRLAVAEKDGQAREDARKMEALAADTARCGTALRSCGARYFPACLACNLRARHRDHVRLPNRVLMN